MKQSFPGGLQSPTTDSDAGRSSQRQEAPSKESAIGLIQFTTMFGRARLSSARRNAGPSERRAEDRRALPAERGVALVITLLMLSIITVVTVAFLALSQRERAAVGQATMQTIAEMATETARERATAQVMARVLNTGADLNLLGPDLFVSLAESNALNNLLRDPWVPVYVTNRASPLGEDRSYLDLNRNGLFEPSGFLPWIDNAGQPIAGPPGHFVGDPMWIGVLEDPTKEHAADNRFIARYCFVVVPAGRTLDLNFAHNSVLQTNLVNQNSPIGYFRNQGFGTWELNLAAFFADLNTNAWNTPSLWTNNSPYQFDAVGGSSSGTSFYDAQDVIRHRYTLPGQTIPSIPRLAIDALPAFTLATTTQNFTNDFIDSFGVHPPMALGRYYPFDPDPVAVNWADRSWAGAGNRRHFFSVHDYFTLGGGAGGFQSFSDRLKAASRQTSSYDRYTFYRMLAQVSTDSSSAQNPDRDKINLNYQNAYIVNTNGTNIPVVYPGWETNFQAWNAREFFLITADRLLTNEFQRFASNDIRFDARIGLLNGRTIPIYVGGSPNTFTNVPAGPTNPPLYLPRIHQILQIAANIFEATRQDQAGGRYPTVFHPTFAQDTAKNVFVTGYEEIDPVKNSQDLASNIIARAWHDLNDPNGVTLNKTNDNIYGIPMIFAAKKGFPNFNEAAVATAVKVSRRIQFRKDDPADQYPSVTNVMFTIGISNVIGVEAWNSYSNNAAYPNQLKMTFACRTETRLTNNGTLLSVHTNATNSIQQINGNTWYGGQFMVPPQIYDVAVSNSAMSAAGTLVPIPANASVFYQYQPGNSNWFHLTLKNKMLFFLEEPGTGRLIDAVALSGMDTEIALSKELEDSDSSIFWGPFGETNQIVASYTGGGTRGFWNSFSGLQLAAGEVALSGAGLQEFLTKTNASAATIVQAGFTPTERVGQLTKWSVNDPLVHYTLADLQPKGTNESQSIQISGRDYSIALTTNALFGALLGKINTDAYRPWGVGIASDTDKPALKDPGVRSSQDWEFPEQKLPNVGWLGRIHRGTPWQTIYLKAGDASTDWLYPAGNAWTMTTHPTNDWRLVDFFTTSPNDLAARGRLSINQTNLAAWSAVFSGIGTARLFESNTVIGSIAMPVDEVFQPASADAVAATAGVAPALAKVVAGINARRAQMPNGMFRTLGEFLSTPELTDASPFLDQPHTDPFSRDRLFSATESMITDFEMERIPAQILSLVTVGEPRFVIYAWGQALQPAPYGVRYNANKEVVINAAGHPQIEPSSIITGLGNGLFKFCGNYQVTAEVATRAVLRIDVDPVGMTNNPPVRPRAVIESFNILPNE